MKQITKEIKDYIHHYVGCDVLVKTDYGVQGPPQTFTGSLHGIYWDRWTTDGMEMSLQVMTEHRARWTYKLDQVTLVLRKLSSMTEEEVNEFSNRFHGGNYSRGDKDEWYCDILYQDVGSPETWRWLLSKGFDLFGLIDAGLAIEKDSGLALDKDNL